MSYGKPHDVGERHQDGYGNQGVHQRPQESKPGPLILNFKITGRQVPDQFPVEPELCQLVDKIGNAATVLLNLAANPTF